MKKSITVGMSAFFILAALAVPASGYVHAHAGHDADEHGSGNQERSVQVRERTETKVEQIKQQVAERRARVLGDVCQRRQDRLQAAIPRLAKRSTALQTAIDGVYERVQGFYDSGQLTVANYDELNGNVSDAQLEAEAAVDAVGDFQFELDCDNPSLGQQMDGFKTAVTEAKEALKTYRTELVGLISALRAEAAEDNTDSGTVEEGNDEGAVDEQE